MKTKMLYPLFAGSLVGISPFLLPAQDPQPMEIPPVEQPAHPSTVSEVMPERAQQILNFWFGTLSGPDTYPTEKAMAWFSGSAELDRLIREQFAEDVQRAANGELNDWRETPRGRLALIILLDQFPRHLFRNSPQAFALDPMARGLVLEGLQKGDDKKLFPIERATFYLPLQHAEDLHHQALSVAAYKQLVEQSPDSIKLQMQEFFNFALAHQQTILRFGRFPYRNGVLGRRSTPEELVYLSQRGPPLF